MKKNYKTLRLILGDQLNAQHSWFKKRDHSILYLIAELHQETSYVRHHVQKLGAFFAAMAEFAKALEKAGHQVVHLTLDHSKTYTNLPELLLSQCQRYGIEQFDYQCPDEYRLLQQLRAIKLPKQTVKTEYDTEHFFLPFEEISDYFNTNKHQTMEAFYRKMRKRFDYLIAEGQPLGGKWNYDADNREKLKSSDIQYIPKPLLFTNNVTHINKRIHKHNIAFIGEVCDALLWPVNRRQALQLLQYFCQQCLPNFGRFQDAMTCNSEHSWSLYHSRISFALNSKMLSPRQVIDSAIREFEAARGNISLAQIEGFVRQILGWREYIRGVYWVNMPGYADHNHFSATRKLPEFFWSGNTNMLCMKQAIGQSLKFAYAHHIQRLMITGNFCLLTGIEPVQVDKWYLGIYIDAIEWVELPNTLGMSLFADGGLVATKPYAAGGNYINKMSDYCKACVYNVKEKTTEDSCPFNSLYWGFMLRHRQQLEKNPRVGMIYRSWDKQDENKQKDQLKRAQWCLDNIENL